MAKKILIVDDDPEDLETMKSVLEKEGYEVTTTENGAEAMDAIEEDKFDLILLDIQMPTLSGYDLLRLLRQRLNGSTKIIYVTIVPRKEVDMKNIEGFIQKPFNSRDLVVQIKKILGGK